MALREALADPAVAPLPPEEVARLAEERPALTDRLIALQIRVLDLAAVLAHLGRHPPEADRLVDRGLVLAGDALARPAPMLAKPLANARV